MLSVLITIRDFLLAAALAWVGVTLERLPQQHDASCAGERCETQQH
ncbi:MAG: hypothetical protein JNJ63_07310 [Hyphomonadaceae bacterium]|nr:hypothetical protein [Hyphomonadaceae bacterium]